MVSKVMIQALPKDIAANMTSIGMWSKDCPVSLDRLCLVSVPYVNFDHQQESGEVICLDVAALHIAAIFKELYEYKFPIGQIKPLHHFGGDDHLSMEANNTSCFNNRKIEGTNLISLHSYGLAIDINPIQNPIIEFDNDMNQKGVEPKAGLSHLNRTEQIPGRVESIVSIFARHGFTVWGGNWATPIDYHHFQVPRDVAEKVATIDAQEGQILFDQGLK